MFKRLQEFKKSHKKPVYFITGGGTGGHIYPAVSIIEALLKHGVESNEIYYLGNDKNLESQIASKNDYNFLSYDIKGMPRKIGLELILWFFKLLSSSLKALSYVVKYKPSVIFATGGYVCAPVLFCALFLRIPYVLHDCDIQPGMVTKFFAPFARNVTLAFEEARKFVKSRNVIITGNPIRQEFKVISKKQARQDLSLTDDFTILIMGGSLGAQKINNSVFNLLEKYANKEGFKIIWQTGKNNFDDVVSKILNKFSTLPDNLVLQPYFDKMYLTLLSSDVVISRAGSLSLSEICASSLPSVLIPYPYASQNHQFKNAKSLADKNIALLLEDKNCNNETLFEIVDNLINDKKLLSDLSYNAYKNAKLNATSDILELIIKAIK